MDVLLFVNIILEYRDMDYVKQVKKKVILQLKLKTVFVSLCTTVDIIVPSEPEKFIFLFVKSSPLNWKKTYEI